MARLASYRAVVGCVVAAIALACVSSAKAQVLPFFIDDFEDGDIQDGMPVSWSARGHVESLGVVSGDLVLTPGTQSGGAVVDGLTYDDVRMHTQLRVSDLSFSNTGFLITPDGAMFWGGGIAGSDGNPPWSVPHTLYIWTWDPNFRVLESSPTTLDPSQADVELRFDAIGDTLTLTGWAEGQPRQVISAQASNRLGGTIGVFIDDSVRPASRTSVTYRFFAATTTADFDFDGDVDGDDFLTWQASFGIDDGGDADFDGDTDGDDFLIWQSQFASPGGGSASVAVPEPGALMLLLGALVGAVVAVRRHSRREQR